MLKDGPNQAHDNLDTAGLLPADVMSDDLGEAAFQAAEFLKSLANPDRLRLLCCLATGDMTVAELQTRVGASQSSVSQHLARLKLEGLVTSQRDGRHVIYQLADQTALQIMQVLYGRFCS